LAPENPFPKPTEECYILTKYVLESKNEFGNTNKVILAGDSAGGNCVAVMTQRLKVEKVKQPILQVLIYPWTQLVRLLYIYSFFYQVADNLNFKLTLRTASGIHYTKHNPPGVFAKLVCWYLGITDPKDISAAMELFETNSHIELLTDSKEREKIKLYCDSNLIPAEYRKEYYYNNYNIDKQFITNKVSNALLNDEKIKEAFKKLISPEISPGFADSEKLIGLPKAYFILSGFDILKDDGLLYAERLRKAGVDVQIKYYENSFHGISQIINKKVGPQVARDMLDDLVVEIKKYL
jgi:arylacetamide deacetylase